MRIPIICTVAMALAHFLGSAATAQTAAPAGAWPQRPVRIVAPYPAGPGPVDSIARVVGERLSKRLHQPFIVDNRPGASGNISTEFVAKAPADGYTLLLGAIGPIAINPHLFKSLPFDPARDLVPVAFAASEGFALVAHPGIGAGSLGELVARIRQKPDGFSYSSSGLGSGTHLAAELFQRAAGVKMLHVPYKGGTAGINDVIAGLVPVTFTAAPLAASFGQAGKLSVLAVTGSARSSLLPNTPTLAELGLPGATSTSWYGFFLPAQTPRALAERIHAELQAALQDPEVLKKFGELGLQPRAMTQQEFADFVKSESARLGALVRAANITAE